MVATSVVYGSPSVTAVCRSPNARRIDGKMSRLIATAAIRGAHGIVKRAEGELKAAIETYGPDKPVAFPNTAYYLPVILGFMGHKVEKLSDLVPVVKHAKELLHPVPQERLWLPYLGETLDCGVATLLAEETIEGIRFVRGEEPQKIRVGGSAEVGEDGLYTLNGPIDDVQLRSWGIQLVDGRMPGFAAIVGAAKSNEVAVKIVRELQQRGILVFLSGNVGGRSIIDQLLEEGVQLGYDTYTVPFGRDTESAIYALGFAMRSALTFGGMKPGQARELLLYNKYRVFAFVLALGEVDDLKYATAAGAISYGFPTIADTNIPNILPTGVTQYEHVVSMPFDEIPGANDLERAERLVQKCIEVRGVKVKIAKVPIPVAYGSAFEGERVRREAMRVEFGGRASTCFEYLRMRDADAVEAGKVSVVGPEIDEAPDGGALPLGIVVEVAGRKMQKDFEPVLERQIHHFINGAEGVQHIGQRDITWIRISKASAEKGFKVKHLGEIIVARMLSEFSAIVDKVQVTLYTEKALVDQHLGEAMAAYRERNERIAGLTDESVDTFYSCTLCQSFAPNHVCIINPERVGLCGAYNWLDCKASHQINPTGPNQPVPKGNCIDPVKGEWDNVNQFVYRHSNQSVERFTFYTMMDAPTTSCGCFECIVMLIPEANGVMVLSREDPSMSPAGMTFSTLAGMAGGGTQSPGLMGVGKYYLTSKKFIKADGGHRRIVWMSSVLKESMAEELKATFAALGEPDLLDKIADERVATNVDELVAFLTEKGHPALSMEPMF